MCTYKEQQQISWIKVEDAVKHIVFNLQKTRIDKSLTQVQAVSRGGLIPGTMLSHYLGLPLGVIHARSYVGKEQGRLTLEIPYWPTMTNLGKGVIIIDDLVDTGQTFNAIREHLPAAHYVSCFNKPLGLSTVDFSPYAVPQDTWLQFPWEV